MRDRGFIHSEIKIGDMVKRKESQGIIGVNHSSKLREAFKLMKDNDISQMVVTQGVEVIGSVTENNILTSILENPYNIDNISVNEIMNDPFPELDENLSYKELSKFINRKIPAVLVKDRSGNKNILTQYDIIQYLH